MKVIFFSDLHVHKYKEFSSTLPDGTNSRLNDTLEVLRRVRSYAKENDIRFVFFGGDLFHKRRILDVGMFNAVYDEIAKFKEADLVISMLVGNHDQATKDGATHSIHSLRDICNVFDEPGQYNFQRAGEQFTVNAVPWMDDKEKARKALQNPTGATKKGHHVLFAHCGIWGATTGPHEFIPKEELTRDDVPMDQYDFGFFGHYHQRQEILPKCWFIGSPLQTTRGEKGSDKGFLVYDTQKTSFEVVPLGLPQFVTLTQNDITSKKAKAWNVKGNFVDVTLEEEPEGGVEEFRDLLVKLGARSVMVDYTPAPKQDPNQSRVVVNPGLSFVTMTEKYVKEYAGGLDPKRVVEMAKQFFAETEDT